MIVPTSVRRVLGASLITLFAATGAAQGTKPATIAPAPAPKAQGQEELIALREKKLAKEVFKNAAWRTDFDAAKAEAKKDGKLLLVYFTRSYAY